MEGQVTEVIKHTIEEAPKKGSVLDAAVVAHAGADATEVHPARFANLP